MNDAEYMMLDEVMSDIPVRLWQGARNVPIRRVVYDTRKVEPGDLFCAWAGSFNDGVRFIPDAVARGAAAVVVEREPEVTPPCPCLVVGSARRTLSLAAANRWGHPARELAVVGITGTNGKSSTAILLHHLLESAGYGCGLMGTIEHRLGARTIEAARTTPEGSDIQEMLAEMRKAGCVAAVMEVSSHALAQGRVEGLPFRGAVFTNLSPDHLDYHRDMESYFLAKAGLFRQVAPAGWVVLPTDDAYGRRLVDMVADDVCLHLYGVREDADSRATDVQAYRNGTSFIWWWAGRRREVLAPWIGAFNLQNILAAMTSAVAAGCDPDLVVECVRSAPAVPGRMQRVGVDELFTILVDYAHTEDALRNVLETLMPLREHHILTLIGCGGNRDRSKRAAMARAACEGSDHVIFTSDNPRDEDPSAIISEMVAGVPEFNNYTIISDRAEAIKKLIEEAVRGDIILIAGKGHETYQEVRGEKHPFSDVDVVTQILKGGSR